MFWRMQTSAVALAVAAFAVGATPAGAKVEGETIVLGSAISLTGKYSTNGVHTQERLRAGRSSWSTRSRRREGRTTSPIKIDDQVYYDDESTPARGAQLAERLINQDGVKYMLGPYSSGLTKAIAPVTEKYGVPMVEAEGASRSLFTQGYKYLFAVLSTSEQYLAIGDRAGSRKGARPMASRTSDLKVGMAVRERSLLARCPRRRGRRCRRSTAWRS